MLIVCKKSQIHLDIFAEKIIIFIVSTLGF